MSKPDDVHAIRDTKWLRGISSGQRADTVAVTILRSRLSAVRHWLAFAAEKSDEDIEYVHRLRVSTRRSVEALRTFSELIPRRELSDLRGKLREIRRAADDARNLDVLCAEFMQCSATTCESTCREIADCVRQRREEAQAPLLALHRDLPPEEFDELINNLLQRIKLRGKKGQHARFRARARVYLQPVVRKFFKAWKADLADDEAFHRLRIRTKKLRYTMEIVEVAFSSRFRKRLYERIVALQDVMGMVNDHATARTFFSDWIAKADDLQHQAFFRGILTVETKAHADLRTAFRMIWTPEAIRKLKREFRACGVTV